MVNTGILAVLQSSSFELRVEDPRNGETELISSHVLQAKCPENVRNHHWQRQALYPKP